MAARRRVGMAVAAGTIAGYALTLAALTVALGDTPVTPDQRARLTLLPALVWAGFGLVAWLLLDHTVFKPLASLVSQALTLAQARQVDRAITPPGHHLAELTEAVAALADALRAARRDMAGAMASATARIAEQKNWLEAILLDLSEGVVVCNAGHQIMLYNQAAVRLLRHPEAMGLGRSLFGVVTRPPVIHAVELLEHRRAEGEHAGHHAERSVPFVCATVDAGVMLQGRMALILDPQGQVGGHVITFEDISDHVAVLAKSDAVRRAVTRDLRGPIAAIRAAAETLAAFPGMSSVERAAFDDAILKDSGALSDRIEALAATYRGHMVGRWPMADIHALDLFNCVARHLAETTAIRLTVIGIPLWLHGESHSLILMLEHLLIQLHRHTGATEFDAESLLGDRRVYVDLMWRGQPIPSHLLDSWQDTSLDGGLGQQTVRDVLDRHGSELWSQAKRGGMALLRVPLLAPARRQFDEGVEKLPPRPEFYDFSLLRQHGVAGALADRSLRELTYVVFDTETTGLQPTQGDEIISIAGVRVVNGRVLTGETFQRLVDPKRPIPPESIRFHGITDAMVKDKPPIEVVLPQFKAFVGDAVLVAHNAAFDLTFLQLKEATCGVSFPNPVLDTLLLSVLVDPAADPSLDGLAERLAVTVVDRHTALGDSFATAEVLTRLIDMVEAKGLATLGEVIRACDRTAAARSAPF